MTDSLEITNAAKIKGKGKAKEGKKDKKGGEKDAIDVDKAVIGDLWSGRLDKYVYWIPFFCTSEDLTIPNSLLPPLLRTFLGLPPTFPSPLSAPLTHVIHSLLTIPFNRQLYSVWFPELPSSRNFFLWIQL